MLATWKYDKIDGSGMDSLNFKAFYDDPCSTAPDYNYTFNGKRYSHKSPFQMWTSLFGTRMLIMLTCYIKAVMSNACETSPEPLH